MWPRGTRRVLGGDGPEVEGLDDERTAIRGPAARAPLAGQVEVQGTHDVHAVAGEQTEVRADPRVGIEERIPTGPGVPPPATVECTAVPDGLEETDGQRDELVVPLGTGVGRPAAAGRVVAQLPPGPDDRTSTVAGKARTEGPCGIRTTWDVLLEQEVGRPDELRSVIGLEQL